MKSLCTMSASRAPLMIRLMVGAVFVSEGLQKFLFPETRGAGRFAEIGLPLSDMLGPLVGGTEVLCGVLILLGLLTRWAAIPLIVIMLVALGTTKVPILLEKGFWAMVHEARTDWSMLLGSLFLLCVGAGRLSLDAWWSRRENACAGGA